MQGEAGERRVRALVEQWEQWARPVVWSTGAAAAAGLMGILLWQAHRLGRSMRTARAGFFSPFEHPDGDVRILVLGDSTGVGLGAGSARHSIAGLVASELGRVAVVNRSRNGARVRDLIAQAQPFAASRQRFDGVVILGGGNDVLHFTALPRLRREARELLDLTARIAPRVVWLGCANIGLAPLFVPPFSWLLGRRTRTAMRVLAHEAKRAGAGFIDFSSGEHHARFVAARAHYFSGDGVHPSAVAYRHGFEALRDQLWPPATTEAYSVARAVSSISASMSSGANGFIR